MRDEKFRLFFTGNQQFKDICESFSELLQFQSLVCNFGTSIKEPNPTNMSNGIFQVPTATNEPIYDYAPGTPEREALLAAYKEQFNSTVDVPMYIGGKEVRTGDLGELAPPHDHQHKLGVFHKGDASHVSAAIDAAYT